MRTSLRIALTVSAGAVLAMVFAIAAGDEGARANGANAAGAGRARHRIVSAVPVAAVPGNAEFSARRVPAHVFAARADRAAGEARAAAGPGPLDAVAAGDRDRPHDEEAANAEAFLAGGASVFVRLDRPIVEAGAVTALLSGHDPLGPRRLALWRLRGARRALLATGESTRSGRLRFPPIPAASGGDDLLVTPIGVTPASARSAQPAPHPLRGARDAMVRSAERSGQGALATLLGRGLGIGREWTVETEPNAQGTQAAMAFANEGER